MVNITLKKPAQSTYKNTLDPKAKRITETTLDPIKLQIGMPIWQTSSDPNLGLSTLDPWMGSKVDRPLGGKSDHNFFQPVYTPF